MAQTALVAELPPCDFDAWHKPAVYDARTSRGPWANMCRDCFTDHAAIRVDELGIGNGQRLVRLPRVGDGVSIGVGSDSYAAVVVRVSMSGKTVWTRRVEADTPGRSPGGFGWERYASDAALKRALEHGTGAETAFTLRDSRGVYVNRGEAARGGSSLRVGVAREYRDPHV